MFSRDRQGWPLRMGTIGCALAGTLVLVSSLASAGALKERSVQLDEFESGDTVKEATARCERSQRAVAGGFFAEAEPPLLIALPLDSTREGSAAGVTAPAVVRARARPDTCTATSTARS